MAFIKENKIAGKSYFYKVESVRIDGKIKQNILEYYGAQNPNELKKAQKMEPQPFSKIGIEGVYTAGPILCLFKLIKEYKINESADRAIKKRQGIPAGLTYFIVALHKLFGMNPSLNNLSDWLDDTPLKINPKVDTSKFNCDNVSYLFDKLFKVDSAVEELENVQARLFHIAKDRFNIDDKNLYYDVTSAYFEGNLCDDAEYGYSRDHRKDKKQINVGLVVTKDKKFPAFSKVFKGNISDKETVVEVVLQMKYIYKFRDVIAIMDRGMTSEYNINILDANEYGYIIGATSTSKPIKKMLINISKHKILREGKKSYTKKGIEIHSLPFTKTIFGKRRRVIIVYNESMAQDKIDDIENKIEQAKETFNSYTSLNKTRINDIENLGKPYVTLVDKNGRIVFQIDEEKIKIEKKKAGKSVLLTTLNETSNKIVEQYFEKDIIEKLFKFTKQYANLRPVRRYISKRVKIDVFLSFVGYYIIAFIRELLKEKKLDITLEKLISELSQIRLISKVSNKNKQKSYEVIGNTKLQKKIIKCLDLDDSVDYLKKVSITSKMSSES